MRKLVLHRRDVKVPTVYIGEAYMQCQASFLLARMRQLKLYNRLLHELSSHVILPFTAETTSKKQA